MAKIAELDDLLEEQEGIITIKQVIDTGISKSNFYKNVDYYELKRVAHGVYASEDAWVDSMYILHLRCPQAVFSHESALMLHNLTDQEPFDPSVTVKTGYNPSNLTKDGVNVYTIKSDLYDVGITKKSTAFGHEVLTYDMERTICDILRSRKGIDLQTIRDAMQMYVRSANKSLIRLTHYAQMFRVEDILKPYLEVLL